MLICKEYPLSFYFLSNFLFLNYFLISLAFKLFNCMKRFPLTFLIIADITAGCSLEKIIFTLIITALRYILSSSFNSTERASKAALIALQVSHSPLVTPTLSLFIKFYP